MYASISSLRRLFNFQWLGWSFFAAGHGKGPVDAIGGCVKRMVAQAVTSRRVDAVINAKEFCEVLRTSKTPIRIILAADDDEQYALSSINATNIFSDVNRLPGIKIDHFWESDVLRGESRRRLSHILAPPDPVEIEIEELNNQNDIPASVEPTTSNLSAMTWLNPGMIVKCCLYVGKRHLPKFFLGEVKEVLWVESLCHEISAEV
jgi:hypothetical protein